MTNECELISLMAHTLGSIGQIVKDASTLQGKYSEEEGYREIKRIYDGYIPVSYTHLTLPTTPYV